MELIQRWTKVLADDPALKSGFDGFIIQATAPFLMVLLILTLLLWLPRFRQERRLLEGVPRWAWYCLGVLCVGAASLRLWWAPHGPQVFFDEINFLEIARGLARDGDFMLPLRPSDDRMLIPIPAAWSFLLSLVFLVTGAQIHAAVTVALGMSILSVALLFLVGWLLFRRPAPALFLACVLAVLPIHLRMSGSMALENGSLFFLLLTWVAVLAWQEQRRPVWLYCAGTAAAWCANWRMENPFVVLPLLVVCVLIMNPQGLRMLRERHLYLVLAGVFAFSLPGLLSYVLGTGQGFYLFYGAEAMRLEQVRMNQVNNLIYWVEGRIHPPEMTALALLGALAWRPRRAALAWTLWVVALQVFYSRIPSADFGLHHALDSWRNAMQPALGFMVLAAAGLEALREGLGRRLSGGWVAAALVVVTLVSCTWPLRYGGFVHSRHVWQEEFYFMQEVASRLPEGARLLAEGHRDHLRSLELHTAELGYASGRDWQRLEISDEAFDRPGAGEPPVFLDELASSKKAGRRTFLYYFGMRGSDWDHRRRIWLHDHLRMRVVAGISMPTSWVCLTLYELEGLSKQGQEWLNASPNPGSGKP